MDLLARSKDVGAEAVVGTPAWVERIADVVDQKQFVNGVAELGREGEERGGGLVRNVVVVHGYDRGWGLLVNQDHGDGTYW